MSNCSVYQNWAVTYLNKLPCVYFVSILFNVVSHNEEECVYLYIYIYITLNIKL